MLCSFLTKCQPVAPPGVSMGLLSEQRNEKAKKKSMPEEEQKKKRLLFAYSAPYTAVAEHVDHSKRKNQSNR